MTRIKERLGIDVVTRTGNTGQFDVVVDGQTVVSRGGNWFTRKFGAGYPDLDEVVAQVESLKA